MVAQVVRRWGRPLLLITAGMASGRCFAGAWWDGLILVALVPLFILLDGTSPRQALAETWLFCCAQFSHSLGWLADTMNAFTPLPWIVAKALVLLLGIYLALYPAVAVWAATRLRRRLDRRGWSSGWARAAWIGAAGVAWSGTEWARGHLLTGFGWNALGYALHSTPPLVQLAAWIGVYGLAAPMIWVSGGVVLVARSPSRQQRLISAGALLAGLGLWAGGGVLRLQRVAAELPNRSSLAVGIVQNNIDQHHKWDPRYAATWLARQIEQTDRLVAEAAAAGHPLDLVVWSEGAVTFSIDRPNHLQQQLAQALRRWQVHLIVGAGGHQGEAPTNSAFHLGPKGTIRGRYDKMHLVPFGEYVPLRRLLFFIEKLVWQPGEFARGTETTRFDVAGRAVGAYICYETAFPELLRGFVATPRPATLLANLTNDGWFGESIGPEQHWMMTRLRAVELGVPIARSAQTGISGVVLPTGAVQVRSGRNRPETLSAVVPLGPLGTIYAAWGDVFAQGCLALLLLWLGASHLIDRFRTPPASVGAGPGRSG